LNRGLSIPALAKGLLFHGNIMVIALTSLVTGLLAILYLMVFKPF
jgi:hypothetical protein